MMNKITREIISLQKELLSFVLIVSFLYGSALLFFGTAYDKARISFYQGNRFLFKGFLVNFYNTYALVTMVLFIIFFFLIFRFLARERAGTFGIDTTKPNYLAAVRDFSAVVFFSVVSCIHVYYPLTGSLFIPVSTIAGIVFAWWAMAVVVNIGGFGENIIETLQDLAVVSGIIIAGKTLPAFFGYFAYSSPVEYLIEVGIIYVIGPGIGVVAYPGAGITVELSTKKIPAYIQSFAISVFLYFSTPFFAALPAFLMLIPFLLVIGAAAIYFFYTGMMSHFADFSSGLFYKLVFPEQNNVFLSAVYSPVLYFLVFFENLTASVFRHWSALIELAAFLSSLHYRMRSYKKRLQGKGG